MANIIIRNYEHINSSFPNWDTPRGKYIRSKAHYEQEMAKAGLVPFDKAEQMAEQARAKSHKPYALSEKARKFIGAVKNTAGKDGKITVSDRFVDGLRKVGVNVDCNYDKLPSHYKEGGFQNDTK